MRVIHRWSVSMPSPDQVYATAPVAFRLLSGPGQATNEVEFAIERCDRDRAGGDRWCDVSTWSQTMALKSNVAPSYFCLAVLAAAVTQLAKTDPPRPYPYREGNSWLDW